MKILFDLFLCIIFYYIFLIIFYNVYLDILRLKNYFKNSKKANGKKKNEQIKKYVKTKNKSMIMVE